MDQQPAGRVTFLFTDLEGSTRFWERAPESMPAVYARHDEILRAAIEAQLGIVYKVVGDAFQAAFPTATGGLQAAIAAQRALLAEQWPVVPAPRVRMALHQIDVMPEPDGDYRTPGLNRLGRLLSASDGGQILLSEALAGDLSCQTLDGAEIIDLGVHRFRDLSPQPVFQVLAPGLPAERAALRALAPHRHNLPQPTTTFIGRSRELDEVAARLLDAQCRALTLIGPGGVGKTRLAIQLAERIVEKFADGVWYVPLAAVMAADQVISEIARVIGVRESIEESSLDAVSGHFAGRETLLILDNLEQIVGAAVPIGELVTRCTQLKLLVTSRAPLGINGEWEYPLPPFATQDAPKADSELTEPDSDGLIDAVQLFAERTRAVAPDFRISPVNHSAVVAICQRLDGLPLAIELAAARGRLLPPAKLLARLESRLPLLTGGPHDAPDRQQTLRKTIDWSYDLLDPPERLLFARLAIFTGGSNLEAVESVCSDDGPSDLPRDRMFDTLESLARQSLVSLDSTAGARVRMLETIREYAQERLHASGMFTTLAARHADYFCRLAVNAEPHFAGADQEDWLDAIAQDHDNLRAAMTHLASTGPQSDLARMADALWKYWWIRGHLREGRDWLRQATRAADGGDVPNAVLARILDGAGALAEAQGDIEPAVSFHERALALWQRDGDRLGQARALENLGIIALHGRGDLVRARELHNAALAHFREAGDRHGVATALKNLGDVALAEEDFAAASTLYANSLVIARELRDTRGIAVGLTSLGALAFLDGDAARAATLYEESLPLWRALGDLPDVAIVLGNLGEALDHLGDIARAKTLYAESLQLSAELGDQQGIAFAHSHLGRIARHERELALAARHYAESAELSRQIDDSARLAESVEGLAGTLLDSGNVEASARLFGMASAIRHDSDSPLRRIHVPEHERDLSAVRGFLGPRAFASLFHDGASARLNDFRTALAAISAASLRSHDR